MIGGKQTTLVAVSLDETRDRVARRIEQTMAKVLHGAELCSEPGKRAAVIVAVSRPLRGSGPLAVMMQGARYTMVYVELQERPDGTEMTVAAGGGETWTGFDFGRNGDLIRLVLSDAGPRV